MPAEVKSTTYAIEKLTARDRHERLLAVAEGSEWLLCGARMKGGPSVNCRELPAYRVSWRWRGHKNWIEVKKFFCPSHAKDFARRHDLAFPRGA